MNPPAPVQINSTGLSAQDQTAVANAYTAGGGQGQNISFAPSAPVSATSLMNPSAPANVPQPPLAPNYTNLATGGAATIANLQPLFTPNPNSTPNPGGSTSSTPTSDLTALFDKYMGTQTPPPSSTDTYNADLNGPGGQAISAAQDKSNAAAATLQSAQDALTATNSKIAGITAQIQANEQLNPAAEYGRVVDIKDKMAQQIVPLQAQAMAQQAAIASAQGNATLSASLLQQAQDHFDKFFTLQMNDLKAQYDQQQAQITSVYDFATKQEQAVLDAQKTQQAQQFSTQQAAMNDVHSQASALMKTDPTVAAKLMSLDPTSPTYQKDAAAIIATMPPQPTTSSPLGGGAPSGYTKADTVEIDTALRTGMVNGQKIGNPIGSDGFIDPTGYVQMMNYWIQQGGTKQSFFNDFPVKKYINPTNTWVWGQLGIPNPSVKATGVTEAEINTALGITQ